MIAWLIGVTLVAGVLNALVWFTFTEVGQKVVPLVLYAGLMWAAVGFPGWPLCASAAHGFAWCAK